MCQQMILLTPLILPLKTSTMKVERTTREGTSIPHQDNVTISIPLLRPAIHSHCYQSPRNRQVSPHEDRDEWLPKSLEIYLQYPATSSPVGANDRENLSSD